MATLHPARAHGLLDRGAIAPGLRADLVLLDDLESFRPARVWKDGRLVAAGGARRAVRRRADPRRRPPDHAQRAARRRRVRDPGRGRRVRVIEIIPGQLITHAREEEPTVRDGLIVADPDNDIAKIAVIERHHATGRIGNGLVRGFGLRDRRLRLDRRARRSQRRDRRHHRRRHGRLRRAAAGDRRRDRGRARRRRPRRARRSRSPACCRISRWKMSWRAWRRSRTCSTSRASATARRS